MPVPIRFEPVRRYYCSTAYIPVIERLNLYNTRHTYITSMLNESINAIDISKQVGNDPEVILKPYASATRYLILA